MHPGYGARYPCSTAGSVSATLTNNRATGGGTRTDALCCECVLPAFAVGGDVASGCTNPKCGNTDPRNPTPFWHN